MHTLASNREMTITSLTLQTFLNASSNLSNNFGETYPALIADMAGLKNTSIHYHTFTEQDETKSYLISLKYFPKLAPVMFIGALLSLCLFTSSLVGIWTITPILSFWMFVNLTGLSLVVHLAAIEADKKNVR